MELIIKKIPGIVTYKEIQLIPNGISNHNYKIISTNPTNSDQLITLFHNKQTWWKVQKEKRIASLFKKKNIPTITVLNTGYINNENHIYKYLLREFIKEKDFDTLLNDDKYLLPKDWINLLTQLGSILGTLHSIPMTSYGLLKERSISGSDVKNIPAAITWLQYIDRLIINRKNLLRTINNNITYEGIKGVDIQNIFNSFYKLYSNQKDILKTVIKPYLIHYDMLFENIIVKYNNQFKQWEISAIIDNEWVSAGDPDIDLIQIENAVYFSFHKKKLQSYWNFFTKSYLQKKAFSKNLNKKRFIYHIIRSLFYLIEVYSTNQKQVYKNFVNFKNVKNNYIFIKKSIDSGKIGYSLFD